MTQKSYLLIYDYTHEQKSVNKHLTFIHIEKKNHSQAGLKQFEL